MGSVYEAYDPNIARSVAIKTILVDDISAKQAEELQERFLREGRAAGLLHHDNIIRVFDADRDQGIAYLVMELVIGSDLDKLIKRREPLTLERIFAIMRDLLAALDHAHSKGIIHRDIKPANLLIDERDRVKLGDFGVARNIGNVDNNLTNVGAPIGTYRYMAPEQMLMQPIDTRVDIWSAGVIFYQLLTGRHPFNASNTVELILAVQSDVPISPRAINQTLPPELDAVVFKALAKQPDQRFASALDFLRALRGINVSSQGSVQSQGLPSVPDTTHASTVITASSKTASPQPTTPANATKSVVVQEMELVYWKDIQDSNEADDFKEYLKQFPNGVYSALAKRRLKRLLPASTDTTSGAGITDHSNKSSSRPSNKRVDASERTQSEPTDDETIIGTVTPARTATPKSEADKVDAERQAAEKVAAEKLAAEKLAAERLALERKAAAEKSEADRQAAERLAAQKAAEKVAAEKLAAEKLAAERLALERKAAAEKAESERRAAERLAAQKAAEKAATEKLAAEKLAAERLALERKAAAEKAESERRSNERAAAQRAEEKLAADPFLMNQKAAEKTAPPKTADNPTNSSGATPSKLIAVFGVAALMVVAGGYFAFRGTDSSVPTPKTTEPTTTLPPTTLPPTTLPPTTLPPTTLPPTTLPPTTLPPTTLPPSTSPPTTIIVVPPEPKTPIQIASDLEPKDIKGAIKLYEKIASGKDKTLAGKGAKRLFEIYSTGKGNVARDAKKSLDWCQQARRLGVPLPAALCPDPITTTPTTPTTLAPTVTMPTTITAIPTPTQTPVTVPKPVPVTAPQPTPTPPPETTTKPKSKTNDELFSEAAALEGTSLRRAKASYTEAANRGHCESNKRLWEIYTRDGGPEAITWQRRAYECKAPGVPKPPDCNILGGQICVK